MCLIFNGYVVTFKHNTIEEYEGVERKKIWSAMQNYEHE